MPKHVDSATYDKRTDKFTARGQGFELAWLARGVICGGRTCNWVPSRILDRAVRDAGQKTMNREPAKLRINSDDQLQAMMRPKVPGKHWNDVTITVLAQSAPGDTVLERRAWAKGWKQAAQAASRVRGVEPPLGAGKYSSGPRR